MVNVSTGIEGNGPSPSAEARELLRATYLRALRDAYSEMQAGRHSRLSQIMQHISVVDQGVDEYEEEIDIHNHFHSGNSRSFKYTFSKTSSTGFN